jgi:hypothetical protein
MIASASVRMTSLIVAVTKTVSPHELPNSTTYAGRQWELRGACFRRTALTPCRRPFKVESFDSFTEDNDPHGEHDFGAFEHEGQRIFWKIDYYARDREHGSENPADPKQTVRVLTIMLASEY